MVLEEGVCYCLLLEEGAAVHGVAKSETRLRD